MIIKQYILFALAFVLFHFNGYAQNPDCKISIHGHVIDAKSGESLNGVRVYIEGIKRYTLSDSLGIFKFDGLCETKYRFTFQYFGYENDTEILVVNKYSHPTISLKKCNRGILWWREPGITAHWQRSRGQPLMG